MITTQIGYFQSFTVEFDFGHDIQVLWHRTPQQAPFQSAHTIPPLVWGQWFGCGLERSLNQARPGFQVSLGAPELWPSVKDTQGALQLGPQAEAGQLAQDLTPYVEIEDVKGLVICFFAKIYFAFKNQMLPIVT